MPTSPCLHFDAQQSSAFRRHHQHGRRGHPEKPTCVDPHGAVALVVDGEVLCVGAGDRQPQAVPRRKAVRRRQQLEAHPAATETWYCFCVHLLGQAAVSMFAWRCGRFGAYSGAKGVQVPGTRKIRTVSGAAAQCSSHLTGTPGCSGCWSARLKVWKGAPARRKYVALRYMSRKQAAVQKIQPLAHKCNRTTSELKKHSQHGSRQIARHQQSAPSCLLQLMFQPHPAGAPREGTAVRRRRLRTVSRRAS